MTTSLQYEEMAKYQIDHIDDIGMKAVELARLYVKLAEVAAIKEQTEVMCKNGIRPTRSGDYPTQEVSFE